MLAALAFRFEASEEVMNGAQRADPSAEEAPEKQCGDKDDHADEQAFVQGVRGQCIRNRNQRIEPEEQSHGVRQTSVLRGTAQSAAELRAEQQQEKKREAKDLRIQTQPGWFQKAH